MKGLLVIFLFLILSSCSRQPLSMGTYRTYQKNAVLMEGNALQLNADKTFEWQHWSDDISSNKKGIGAYKIESNQLILTFQEYPNQESKILQKKLQFGLKTKGYTYQFKIMNKDNKPMTGVNIVCYNAEDKMLSGGVSSSNGTLSIALSATKNPQKITCSYLGFEEVNIDLSEDNGSKAFEVNLIETVHSYKVGEKEIYRFKAGKNGFLTLKKGNKKKVLKLTKSIENQ